MGTFGEGRAVSDYFPASGPVPGPGSGVGFWGPSEEVPSPLKGYILGGVS